MNAQKAYCPQCHDDVVFVISGDVARCPVCRFEYQVKNLAGLPPPKLPSPALEVGRVLLKVFLIIIGLVILGVAVLFAGCALIMSGSHF
jgi:hypothetical protein